MNTKLIEVQRLMADGIPATQEAGERGVHPRVINKERFAALIVGGMSTEDAAIAVGVSPATGYNWAKDEDVRALVKEWRTEVKEGLVRKLVRHGNVAVETVVDIMQDREVSAQTRLQAAFGVLDRLGLSPSAVNAGEGQEGAKVVFENIIQLNVNAALEQQQRATRREQTIEGEYKVVEDKAA